TNLDSRKAEELTANPRAALVFHWKSLGRQVRIEGDVAPVTAAEADAYVAPVTAAEADAYCASRARDSQIGAWASDQSRPLAHPGELQERFQRFARQYAERPEVPRPANWSGFRASPDYVEFWQERPFRLHDRVVFTRDGERWRKK